MGSGPHLANLYANLPGRTSRSHPVAVANPRLPPFPPHLCASGAPRVLRAAHYVVPAADSGRHQHDKGGPLLYFVHVRVYT